MSEVSTRYNGIEYYDINDLKRIVRRWGLRFVVSVTPRKIRRQMNPRRWPVAWRARLNLASDDELADLARSHTENKERRKHRGELSRRKGEYRKLIIEALARAGAAYKWTEDGHRIVRKIKFERINISLDASAIYFKVNTRKLPDRVLIAFLRNPDVVETVAAACQRQVEFHWDVNKPDEGFWYVVQLRQGVHGIPAFVEYSRMLELLEERKRKGPLTLPIGVGVNGKAEFDDLDDFPHCLVAGATGTGKSVWMKQAITTLALRNTQRDLRFVMIDCKGGVELNQFERLPHILKFVYYKEDVPDVLKMVLREVNQRMNTFREVGVVDLKGYNQRRFLGGRPLKKLERWVVVIDELASLMLSTVKKEVEPVLTDILQLSRAAGIHVIAATQRPSVDVITGLIKANIPVRIAFSTASGTDSRTIIDVDDAQGLSPKGRMIFMRGDQKTQLQGPFVSPMMVDDKVGGVGRGESEQVLERSKRHNYTPIDYFTRALLHYKGAFKILELWQDFKPFGVSRAEVEKVAEQYQGKQIEIDGRLYELRPGQHAENGKRVARQLVDITPETEIPDPQPEPGQVAGAGFDVSDFQPLLIPVHGAEPDHALSDEIDKAQQTEKQLYEPVDEPEESQDEPDPL